MKISLKTSIKSLKKHQIEILLLAGCLALFVFALYKVLNIKPVEKVVAPPEAIPTLTEEKISEITKVETFVIEINDFSAIPDTLTVKVHDQVEFSNKSSKTVTIVLPENKGTIPLSQGLSFTEIYETAGDYSYAITAPGTDLKVTVKVE